MIRIFILAAFCFFSAALPAPAQSADRQAEHASLERQCASHRVLLDALRNDNKDKAFTAVITALEVAEKLCNEALGYLKELAAAPAASAAPWEDRKPWYQEGFEGAPVTTLQGALAQSRKFLGAGNAGYHLQGSAEVCAALRRVKLPCDYNTRWNLSMFLTVNGKGLFPAAGGTNPYFTANDLPKGSPDDGFIGRPVQNRLLALAIRRNARLFHNGDLTADAVQSNWQ